MLFLRVLQSIFVALSFDVMGSDFWGDRGYHYFIERLPNVSSEEMNRLTSHYSDDIVMRMGLDINHLRTPGFSDLDPVLNRAAKQGLGILDLFTLEEFSASSSTALLIDGETLEAINKRYDLNSVWVILAESKLPDHRPIKMSYLILGQGKLIIGYPHRAPVDVVVDGEAMEYQYNPFITAKVVNEGDHVGLFAVKTLDSPKGPFGSFHGPMGSVIVSYEVKGDSILVTYNLLVDQQTTVDKKPIVVKH